MNRCLSPSPYPLSPRERGHRTGAFWPILGLAVRCVAGWCLTAAACGPAGAAERWAIVAAAEVQESGLSDLLTARLSRHEPDEPEIELVERDRLDAALRELELAACFGPLDGPQRMRLGQLVRADVLVLLSVEQLQRQRTLRIVIAQCTTGVRLRQEAFAGFSEQRVDELAAQCVELVRQTRRHFADGVETVLAVSPFLSKNLTHDYDHLQAGWAALIEAACSRYPGVAVVELEEARAIRAELGADGRLGRRVVPLFVEGDFHVTVRGDAPQPSVRLKIRLTDGQTVRRHSEHDGLTLDEATLLVSRTLPAQLLGISADTGVRPLTRRQQFDLLAARARAFSDLGARRHAAALREAALLLEPEAHDERLRLVVDYRHWLDDTVQEQLRSLDAPDVQARIRAREAWFPAKWEPARNMVYHAGEAIRRRGVNPREAGELLLLTSARTSALPLASAEQELRRTRQLLETFLWDAVRQIPHLDDQLRDGRLAPPLRRSAGLRDEDRWSADQQDLFWQDAALRCVVRDWPTIGTLFASGRNTGDYGPLLDNIERLLAELPENDAPLPGVLQMILSRNPGGLPFLIGRGVLQRDDVEAFYQRLARSDSPLLAFYGRFGLWECRQAQAEPGDEAMRREAEELLSHLRERCGDRPDLSVMLRIAETEMARRLGTDRLPTAASSGTTRQAKVRQGASAAGAGTETPPKGHPLTPSPIAAAGQWTHLRFSPAPLEGPMRAWELIPADTCDVLWSPTSVEVLERNESREVVVSRTIFEATPPTWLTSVVWDGRYIWAATSDRGVLILKLDGTVASQLDPSAVPPLSGRALATGDPEAVQLDPSAEPLPLSGMALATGEPVTAQLAPSAKLPPYETWSHRPDATKLGSGPARLLSAHPQRTLWLHPVAAGQCLISGVYGPRLRRWFAVAGLSPESPADRPEFRVRTIHVADKSGSEGDAVDTAFSLAWWTEYAPADGSRKLLIGRRVFPTTRQQRPPLTVDLNDLSVDLFPAPLSILGEDETPRLGHAGRIFVAGPLTFSALGPAPDWPRAVLSRREPGDPPQHGQLLLDGGRIYRPGPVWWRADPHSLRIERLNEGALSPEDRFERYASSALLGLTAWNVGQRLHRVEVTDQRHAMVPRDDYVPQAWQSRHRRAAARLREAGAQVGGQYGPPRGEPESPATWRTVVYVPRAWHGGDQGLAWCADLYHLTDLYLVGAPVTDRGLQHVGQLHDLETLCIEETRATDAGISHLVTLNNLRYLRLEAAAGEPAFSDAALPALSGLPRLSGLTLYGPGFTDAAVETLGKFPSLSRLLLLDCAVTGTGRETLQRTRPHLRLLPKTVLTQMPHAF